MAEVLAEQESEGLDIRSLLGIVRRRHFHFLIPLFLGWFVVWGISWILPPRYKSSTTILVEQPTMPQNYVAPNINDDLQARLASMSEQILSRTRLLLIIQKLHLYGGAQGNLSDDQKIASLRKDIGVDLVRDPQRQDISAFTISYSARNPRLAQQVTAELTELFISENLKVRQQESEGTTDFLEKQLEDAREDLSEQEAKVREFERSTSRVHCRRRNKAISRSTLACSRNFRAKRMLSIPRSNSASISRLCSSKSGLLWAGLQSSGPGQRRLDTTDLATIDEQLEKLRAQLADLSSRYTDNYPDVQNTKSQITKLEAVRDNLIAASKASEQRGEAPAIVRRRSNPYRPGAADSEPIAGQPTGNRNRESRNCRPEGQAQRLSGAHEPEPATEEQLADLTRGYDQSKQNYDDLLKKKDESAMATSMEEMQQGERFTMLDPPSLPSKPDFPNRLKFCGIGLAAGFALGIIVAGGFEFMDDRLHTEKEIKSLLPSRLFPRYPRL